MRKIIALIVALGLAGLLAYFIGMRIEESRRRSKRGAERGPVPVAVAPISSGSIELRRTYSGTLIAHEEFVLAPKVAGRIAKLHVDISDVVTKGQVVAELDDAEFLLELRQAEADLAVATARVAEADSALEIADRELGRMRSLRDQGIASVAQLDTALAVHRTKEATTKVSRALVMRSQAALSAAKLRLDDTKIRAEWGGADGQRTIGQRFNDAGANIAANAPLLSILSLDPIKAVVYVTERDYGQLSLGQKIELSTDAYGERRFPGVVSRIASVFRESSRQARVELAIGNPGHLLKPGMFVRAEIVLRHIESSALIPVEALARRKDLTGVFLLSPDSASVRWQLVRPGIRSGNTMSIAEELEGQVVTIGQQLIEDGSKVVVRNGRGVEAQ